MPDAAARIEEITRDLACPACQYNLRGLRGAVVTCPECGAACDVAELVTRRWTRPWWEAPGYNKIVYPTAVALVGCVSLGVAQILPLYGGLGLLAMSGLYAFTHWWAYRLFDSILGNLLALLAHAIMAGYVIGLLTAVISGGLLIVTIIERSNGYQGRNAGSPTWLGLIVFLALFALGLAMLYGFRRAERYIAGRCIQRYLDHKPR